MPAPKGSRNAKAYQDSVKSKNKTLIEGELKRLKDVRASFNSITALSEAVAKETGLSAFTIRRNQAYRSLITKYISEQSGRSGYVSRAESELVSLRHKITELEVRLSNILADNARLHAFVKKLKDAETTNLPQIQHSSLNTDGDSGEWEQNCMRTYHLVQAILSRAEFLVDFEKCAIEDPAGIDDNEIVAGANIAEPYIEWVKSKELRNG